MARVRTSESARRAGRPGRRGVEGWLARHQSSTDTYNETRKESRSTMRHHLWEKVRYQHKISAPSLCFAITHQTSEKCPQGTRSDLLRRRSFQPGHALLRDPEDSRPHEGGIGARIDVTLCFEVAHRREEGVGISNDSHFFGHRCREDVYVGAARGLLLAHRLQ